MLLHIKLAKIDYAILIVEGKNATSIGTKFKYHIAVLKLEYCKTITPQYIHTLYIGLPKQDKIHQHVFNCQNT